MIDCRHKIGLGTVQFGVDYGITNTEGMTPLHEVGIILDLAARNGIDLLDTAHLYGESEIALGQAILPGQDFKIITKTPDFGKMELHGPDEAAGTLEAAFHRSLKNLNTDHVYGLMVHNAGGMKGPYAQAIYDTLAKLRQSGKVRKIGLSVYSAADIDHVIKHCGPIDIVQVPCNVFDQRLILNGYLRDLKASGVEIHARSLFLQGALLSVDTPEKLQGFGTKFSAYRELLKNCGIGALKACLAFGFAIPEVDKWIIGVNNAEQFEDIIDIAKTQEHPEFDFSALASDDENLINPALWPKS